MNWKLRLKNKQTLMALAAAAIAFVYQVLGIFGIVPAVSTETMINLVGLILNVLVAIGIVVDPTTAGFRDSARALTYDQPKEVTVPDDDFPVGGEGPASSDLAHEANDPEDPEV